MAEYNDENVTTRQHTSGEISSASEIVLAELDGGGCWSRVTVTFIVGTNSH